MSRRPLRIIAFSILGLLVALDAAALLVRFDFVVRSDAMAATTAGEGTTLYNIWKVVHGLPLYEWPQKGTLLLTIHNAGFYGVSALWARLWEASGPELVPCVRWLTLLGALGGMLVNVALLRRFAPPARSAQAWIWGLSLVIWFGTSFTGWDVLTARPTVAAAALALGGLAMALRAGDEQRRDLMLVSSALFFAAWSFQASTIGIFVGTVLHVCFRDRRRWPTIPALVGPFAGAAALMVVLGGDAYRYNLFSVPFVFRWFPAQGLRLLARTVALNLFFGGAAIWAAVRCLRGAAGLPPGERTIAFVAVPPAVAGTVALAQHGAGTAAFMEAFVMLSLLGSLSWLRVWASAPARWPRMVGLALLLTMIPLPALQLVQSARGKSYATVKGVAVGNLVKLSPGQLDRRRAFAAWIRDLPHPLWTGDAMLELPWFSSNDRYPVFPRDALFEADAHHRGAWPARGFSSWVQRRFFAGLLLRPSEGLRKAAHRAGYVEVPVPAEFKPLFPTAFGIEEPAPRLFLRGPARPPAGKHAPSSRR